MLARALAVSPRTTETSVDRALATFLDRRNARIVEAAVCGLHVPARDGTFDPVNERYGLRGDRRVTTFADAFRACLCGPQKRDRRWGWDLTLLDLQALRECAAGALDKLRMPSAVYDAEAVRRWKERSMDEDGDVIVPEEEPIEIPGGEPLRDVPPPPVVAMVPVSSAPLATRDVVVGVVEPDEWEADGNRLRAVRAEAEAMAAARNAEDSRIAEQAMGAKPPFPNKLSTEQRYTMFGRLGDSLTALCDSGAITVAERNARRRVIRAALDAAYLLVCPCGVVRPNRSIPKSGKNAGIDSIKCPSCGADMDRAAWCHREENANGSYVRAFARFAADMLRLDGEIGVSPPKAERKPRARRAVPVTPPVGFVFPVCDGDDEDDEDEDIEEPTPPPPKPTPPVKPKAGHLKLVK